MAIFHAKASFSLNALKCKLCYKGQEYPNHKKHAPNSERVFIA